MANISVNTQVDNEKTFHDSNKNSLYPEGKGDSTLQDCNSPSSTKMAQNEYTPDLPIEELGNKGDNDKSDREESASNSSKVGSSKQNPQEMVIKSIRVLRVPYFKSHRVYSWKVVQYFLYKPLNERMHTINYIRDIQREKYFDMKIRSPEFYSCQFIRVFMYHDSSITLEHPFLPEGEGEKHLNQSKEEVQDRIKLVSFKRSDQYIKKFLTKLNIYIYREFKTYGVLKQDAQNMIKEEYGFTENDKYPFQNLFESDIKHGLKMITVNFILSHEFLFNKIFTRETIFDVVQELNIQTEIEIEINIMEKLEEFIENEETPIEFRFNKLCHGESSDRSFKMPFTFYENLLAAKQFVALFIKACTKNTIGMKEYKQNNIMRRLKSLMVAIERRLHSYMTLDEQKFKKSQIVSGLKLIV